MTTAIIPARYGSSRLAGKPLIPIAGKPMIQRVVDQARKAPEVTDVWVATDDPRIVSAVEAFNGQALLTGSDCRTGTDRVARAADHLGLGPDEIVINIQGDQPLFHPAVIHDLLAPFNTGTDLLMSTLACRIQNVREITDPKDVKVVFDTRGAALYFSRAQIPFPRDGDCGGNDVNEGTYFKHLGFYAYRKSFLDRIAALPTSRYEQVEKLEQLRVLEAGYPIQVVVTAFDSPEVDLPEDIQRMETRLRHP